MKRKRPDRGENKQDENKEGLTRRKAIKRIAAICAGAAIGTGLAGNASHAQTRYISAYTGQAVYGSASGQYSSVQMYSSYRSHYTSVPPPYSSRR
jgi:hypothetical protein